MGVCVCVCVCVSLQGLLPPPTPTSSIRALLEFASLSIDALANRCCGGGWGGRRLMELAAQLYGRQDLAGTTSISPSGARRITNIMRQAV